MVQIIILERRNGIDLSWSTGAYMISKTHNWLNYFDEMWGAKYFMDSLIS